MVWCLERNAWYRIFLQFPIAMLQLSLPLLWKRLGYKLRGQWYVQIDLICKMIFGNSNNNCCIKQINFFITEFYFFTDWMKWKLKSSRGERLRSGKMLFWRLYIHLLLLQRGKLKRWLLQLVSDILFVSLLKFFLVLFCNFKNTW